MNITHYSHETILSLIGYCIILGFLSGGISCIISAFLGLRKVFQFKGFNKLKLFVSFYLNACSQYSFLSDFLSVLVIGIALLLSSYLSNNGIFRMVSVPIFCLGYIVAICLLHRLVLYFFSVLIFIITCIIKIVFTPIVYIWKIILRVIKRYYNIVKQRRNAALIVKYTRKKYKDLDNIKQNGLLGYNL